MKHYRNLNGCVSKMHRVIYDAYDRGYAQGRKDFEKTPITWLPVPQDRYTSYRCSGCNSLAIARYKFCPHCGSPMSEDSYVKD